MEGPAGSLEGQPAVLEETADVRLRLAHQLFVLDVQHLAGQHRVPVIHERQITPIVATQVVEVVAEGLPLREVLLEGAKARIHRMPARVDDRRIRQDGMDESDMAEIIG